MAGEAGVERMTIDELRIMADAAQCRFLTSYATALHAAADMLAAKDAEIESLRSQLRSAWAVIKRQHDAGLRDKPEVSMERADLDAAIAGVCADLERENAEFRKDAERYRFIRAKELPAAVSLFEHLDEGSWELKSEQRLDEAIDKGLKNGL